MFTRTLLFINTIDFSISATWHLSPLQLLTIVYPLTYNNHKKTLLCRKVRTFSKKYELLYFQFVTWSLFLGFYIQIFPNWLSLKSSYNLLLHIFELPRNSFLRK